MKIRAHGLKALAIINLLGVSTKLYFKFTFVKFDSATYIALQYCNIARKRTASLVLISKIQKDLGTARRSLHKIAVYIKRFDVRQLSTTCLFDDSPQPPPPDQILITYHAFIKMLVKLE